MLDSDSLSGLPATVSGIVMAGLGYAALSLCGVLSLLPIPVLLWARRVAETPTAAGEELEGLHVPPVGVPPGGESF
jgi:hypothetical protein